jgi:hypothetical protein
MTYLICYDISNDKLRDRLAKRFERAGCVRLQKSVFIAPDFDLRRLAQLRGGIAKILPFPKGTPMEQLGWGESVLVMTIEKDNLSDIVWAGDALFISTLLQKVLFKIL